MKIRRFSMKPKLFRRKFIIYPQFQYVIVAVNIIILFCSFMFMALQLERSFLELYHLGNEVNLSPDHVYFKFLAHHSSKLFQSLAIASLVSFIFSVFITVSLSHKLAGPIVRLREHLRRFGNDKKYEPLSFRKGDFFNDLPEIVNKALSSEKGHEQQSGDQL